MAGLPWVKVATDFAEHPKALALAHRLGDPRAPLYLPPVWGHFARHYAGGSMPGSDDAIRALERAALWAGAAGALVSALVEVGLLERRRNRLRVHGWGEWQEGHARKLEADRARMRERRRKARESSRAEDTQRPATTQDESRDRRALEETERRGEREDPSSLRSEGAPPVSAEPSGEAAQPERSEPPAPAPALQPLPVHLQGSCPLLAEVVARARFGIAVGKRATVWGAAENLVTQLGLEAALALAEERSPDSRGFPESVPLSYLTSVWLSATKQRANGAARPRGGPIGAAPAMAPEAFTNRSEGF